MDLLRQAGRTESVHNGELLNSFQICGTKKGPARRFSCKPLICLVPEPGIEPGRPYERGDFKSLVVALNFFLGLFAWQSSGRGENSLSDFSSDIVTRHPAALGVVSTSACCWSPVFAGAE